MKKLSKIFIIYLLLLSAIGFINSCEDPMPTDFIQQKYVEAFLIVGEPIKDIKVINTQSLDSAYNYDGSLIKNAKVQIYEGETELNLIFDELNFSGYYYEDSTYLIKPNTKYTLKITLPDNSLISGTTTTPKTFNWITKPKKIMNYPSGKDSLELPFIDSLVFNWENILNLKETFYFISVRCLDTLEYGKYLNPATAELNRRIIKPYSEDRQYREINRWSFMPSTFTPVVWSIFRWYGLHEVSIYAPDPNFFNWGKQYFIQRNIDPLLQSVKGGIGYFGSASVVRDTSFLVKNQP